MNFKKILFTVYSLLLLTSFSPAIANDSITTFDIGDYIPVDFKYHSLTLYPNIGISGNNSNEYRNDRYFVIGRNDPIIMQSYDYQYYYNNFSNNLGIRADHNFQYYTKKIDYSCKNSISTYYSTNSLRGFSESFTKYEDYYNYSNNISQGLGYSVRTQNSLDYYLIKNWFVGIMLDPYLYHTPYNASTTEDKYLRENSTNIDSSFYSYTKSDYQSTYINFSLMANIRTGLGRINDVTYAVIALNMLDRVNSVTNRTGKTDIHSFAGYIEKLKRRRRYDTREALIDDINNIFQYLKSQNVIDFDSSSACVTMELYDQWLYAERQKRYSGIRYQVYPDLSYRYYKRERDTERDMGDDYLQFKKDYTIDDIKDLPPVVTSSSEIKEININRDMRASAVSDFSFYRPLNRFFQLNILLLGKMGAVSVETKYETDYDTSIVIITRSSTYPRGEASITGTLIYYPNTRTSVTLTAYTGYVRFWDYIEYTDDYQTSDPFLDYRNLNLSLYLNVDYYISPRFSFDITGGISYNDYYHYSNNYTPIIALNYINTSAKTLGYSISAGLNYDIF